MRKPTADEIRNAVGRTLPDLIALGLQVLFCGINPGLYSVAVQHHFAKPGNRFWPTLFAAGITSRLLAPDEECELMALGYGITDIVERATAGAAELTRAELIAGVKKLEEKVLRFAPRKLAVLGISAYRTAFNHPKAGLGRQEELIGGTQLWVLPNPSGLNALFQIADLAECFKELKE